MSHGSQSLPFSIRPARPADAPVLAQLMSEEIHWGRLSALGLRFTTLLHRHMIGSRFALCYVAERDGEIIGYAAAAIETSKFYRQFLLRHGLTALVILFPQIFRWRKFQTILRGLTYFPEAREDDPQAEMLSLAVRSHAKRSGVGQAVLDAIYDQLRARGITAVKFGTADVRNDRANALYRQMGARLVRTVPFYDDSAVNVYVYRLD